MGGGKARLFFGEFSGIWVFPDGDGRGGGDITDKSRNFKKKIK